MKVVELSNLCRKISELHYRKEFTGSAVLESLNSSRIEIPVEFVYELDAIGTADIRVKLLEDIDYPLLPILKSIKSLIQQMDKKGQLP